MISLEQTLFSIWKTESIPPKIRNKTRVSTFTTIIQHSCGSPSYSNQRKKRSKRHPDRKRRSKTLTTDDVILYIPYPNCRAELPAIFSVLPESFVFYCTNHTAGWNIHKPLSPLLDHKLLVFFISGSPEPSIGPAWPQKTLDIQSLNCFKVTPRMGCVCMCVCVYFCYKLRVKSDKVTWIPLDGLFYEVLLFLV